MKHSYDHSPTNHSVENSFKMEFMQAWPLAILGVLFLVYFTIEGVSLKILYWIYGVPRKFIKWEGLSSFSRSLDSSSRGQLFTEETHYRKIHNLRFLS
jgi:hypothetical protein